jgi:hypothetical protein
MADDHAPKLTTGSTQGRISARLKAPRSVATIGATAAARAAFPG